MTGPAPEPRFLVILVEPEDSINVGNVARAMSNLAFDELRLVSPRTYSKARAEISACWGEPVLASAKIFDDTASAVSDCHEVYGFSSQSGKDRIPMQPLSEWKKGLTESLKVGLLFGPESTGLRAHHWQDCLSLVSIPSSRDNPSYNLAQAVLLVLYELRGRFPSNTVPTSTQPLASIGDEDAARGEMATFHQLDRTIDELGTLGGFINENSPPEIKADLQHMFRRIKPSNRELSILMGLFSGALRKLRRE